jgi:hypothetical protein
MVHTRFEILIPEMVLPEVFILLCCKALYVATYASKESIAFIFRVFNSSTLKMEVINV